MKESSAPVALLRPDGIDSRLVLVGYAIVSIVAGLVILNYRWPPPPTLTLERITVRSLWSLIVVTAGNLVWLSGAVAWGLASIEDSVARLRALRALAIGLMAIGLLYYAPAWPILRTLLPPGAAWPPIVAGVALLALSFDPTMPGRGARRLTSHFELRASRRTPAAAGASVVFHDVPTPVLRTRYEEQIRHGARQEERARLARELHDAVKQQLFAIHTAAATVDARFDSDPAGARDALAQVRASAREALTEMEVMLDQLKATALTTAGLVEALKRACEAMGFRTGAEVSFTAGDLPPDSVFPPGAHLAMLRFAQEALANVARHARAAHVRIRFGIDQEWTPPGSDRRRFVLSISDDGQGFDVSASPRGMGLRSMAGRAAEAGGAMELTSTAGQGTTVSLMMISDAATRRRYLTYAALCAALVIVLLLSNAWNQTLGEPWDIAWLVLAVIAAVRFAVAARRVRSWR